MPDNSNNTDNFYRTTEYDREASVKYAHEWAFKRNPRYAKFDGYGGDCTNFVSQALFASCRIMNHTPVYGWYYININQRTASWTGVAFLYNFLTNNKKLGPYGVEVEADKVQPGDVSQISFKENGTFTHSQIIVETGEKPAPDNILIATHSYDSDYRALTTYAYKKLRFIHIEGIRRLNK